MKNRSHYQIKNRQASHRKTRLSDQPKNHSKAFQKNHQEIQQKVHQGRGVFPMIVTSKICLNTLDDLRQKLFRQIRCQFPS